MNNYWSDESLRKAIAQLNKRGQKAIDNSKRVRADYLNRISSKNATQK